MPLRRPTVGCSKGGAYCLQRGVYHSSRFSACAACGALLVILVKMQARVIGQPSQCPIQQP